MRIICILGPDSVQVRLARREMGGLLTEMMLFAPHALERFQGSLKS